VNQGRRLKTVASRLAAHEASRSLVQFAVHQRSQPLERAVSSPWLQA
jgi:hypothetical protein